MSDHTERGIHADRDRSEEPYLSALRDIGEAWVRANPHAGAPYWPTGTVQRARTAAQEATGHTETGETEIDALRAELDRAWEHVAYYRDSEVPALRSNADGWARRADRAEAAVDRLTDLLSAEVERRVKAEAEARRLAGVVERVRALHHRASVAAITGDCAAEECDHEDECPTRQVDVCWECWSFATSVHEHYGEHGLSDVLWPCDTARALDADAPEASEEGRRG